jgi:hypothetical protein
MSWPKPPHLSFGEPFPAEAGPGSPGVPLDRSPGGSPGSRPGPKPLPFTVRFAAFGRSLGGPPVRKVRIGRSRSVPFRPESVSAEAGNLPGWVSVRAEALPVLLPKHVSAEADPFFRFGSPSKLAPRRFSFGGPVKPKLRVPPGLLHEACRPCKSMGQARSVRMAAASSAALP